MAPIRYSEGKPDPRQYAELLETTGWNSVFKVDVNQLATALDSSWYFVAVYDGSRLVGTGRVVSDGVLYAMLYDIIVRPSHQTMGIGTTILQMLVDRCKEACIREIQLFSAKGKAAFYRNRGFVDRPEDAPGMRLRAY